MSRDCGVACFQLESESGVGVGSRSRFFKIAGVGSWSRVFKNAGVGVGFKKVGSRSLESIFLNLNNLWDGVGILKNLPTPQPCHE